MKKDILLIGGIIMLIVLNTVGWLYNACPPCDCPETIAVDTVYVPPPGIVRFGDSLKPLGDTVPDIIKNMILDTEE